MFCIYNVQNKSCLFLWNLQATNQQPDLLLNFLTEQLVRSDSRPWCSSEVVLGVPNIFMGEAAQGNGFNAPFRLFGEFSKIHFVELNRSKVARLPLCCTLEQRGGVRRLKLAARLTTAVPVTKKHARYTLVEMNF